MPTIRSAQVIEPGGSFTLVERELPEPGARHVRVTVEACGVCATDAAFVNGAFPDVSFPLVCGHEIAGRIDALGEDVADWSVGDRVGVGWFGGHCGHCVACRKGDFIHCEHLEVPGWAYPGGYSEAVVVPANALARIPDAVSAVDAAPMGCAGVTTFNALRHSVAEPGDVVAVLGLGGVGHLGVQFAAKLGFETISIARGPERAEQAAALGAHHYIDSRAENAVERLRAHGGAAVVLATVPNADAMSEMLDGLAPNGELLVIGGAPEPVRAEPLKLIPNSQTVHGHPSGTARDVEETLRFAALTGIRPTIETRPLDDVQSAYDRMLDGEARLRMVLTTDR
jgi:alcohol dehydrogenase